MILPMKKATIACLAEDREALLDALFSIGEVMIIKQEDSIRNDEAAAQDLQESEQLLKDMKPYTKKKGMLDSRPEVTYDEFKSINAEAEALEASLREKLDLKNDAIQRRNSIEATLSELEPWQKLSQPVESLTSTRYTAIILGSIPDSKLCKLKAEEADYELEIYEVKDGRRMIAAVCYARDEMNTLESLKEYGFEQTALPITQGLISEEYNRLAEMLTELDRQIEEYTSELETLGKRNDELLLLHEQKRAQFQKESADMLATERTVCIEGWVRADRTDRVTQAVRSVSEYTAVEYSDPADGEKPPTASQNNKVVSQFESVTNMFSAPAPGEIDPNPIMAPWYWLIFGMMMGDVGYGFLMIVATLLFKKIKKPKGNTAKLVNVLFYSGFTTMLCGALFGSYFGETWHPLLFAPLEGQNILYMLGISLGIGLLHIFCGMIVKMVADFRRGDWAGAIFDQLSWMVLLVGLLLLFLPQTSTVGKIMTIAGALTILFTAGRKKKGLGKITGGLLGLYDITSYVSDILSYSRILALSISTGIIGMVMNILAKLVVGMLPPLGYLFAAVICIIGHLFNLAMGLLSAYVHDCRLQYIEFFNRFYEGGGVEFKPFGIKTVQIDLINHKPKAKKGKEISCLTTER